MEKDGRSGEPGNERVSRKMGFYVPHPERLGPGIAGIGEGHKAGKVPTNYKGKYNKPKIVGRA